MARFKFISFLSKQAVKHAPALCVGAGACGVIVGTVLACKATYDKKEEIDEIKEELWTDTQEKELVKTYVKASGKILRIYALPVGVSLMGLFVMLYGHQILTKRHLALIAAYEALNKSYKNYRENVISEHGEDADRCYKHNLKTEMLNDEVVYVPKDDIFIPDRDLGDFAQFFGEGYSVLIDGDTNPDNDPYYTKKEITKKIAREIEQEANDIFQQKGYLFLSDVYSMLGLIDAYAPDGIGWVKGRGDDYVSFGIFEVRNANAISGDEDIFYLDFNHDGYILPYI